LLILECRVKKLDFDAPNGENMAELAGTTLLIRFNLMASKLATTIGDRLGCWWLFAERRSWH